VFLAEIRRPHHQLWGLNIDINKKKFAKIVAINKGQEMIPWFLQTCVQKHLVPSSESGNMQ